MALSDLTPENVEYEKVKDKYGNESYIVRTKQSNLFIDKIPTKDLKDDGLFEILNKPGTLFRKTYKLSEIFTNNNVCGIDGIPDYFYFTDGNKVFISDNFRLPRADSSIAKNLFKISKYAKGIYATCNKELLSTGFAREIKLDTGNLLCISASPYHVNDSTIYIVSENEGLLTAKYSNNSLVPVKSSLKLTQDIKQIISKRYCKIKE